MNEISAELFLYLYAKIEEYIVRGILQDLELQQINMKEYTELFKIARLQTGVPGLFNRYLSPTDTGDEDDMGKMCMLIEAGSNIPKEVLEAGFEKYKSTLGLAIAKNGKLIVQRKQSERDVEKTFSALEKNIEYPFCIQVENIKKVIDEQPFVIYGSDDEPIIVAFLGGADFSSFERPKEIHSGEYQFAMNILSPFISKIMTADDGDIDALMSDLVPDEHGEGGDMSPKLKSKLPTGAYLVLMTNKGHLAPWDNGENEHPFEWGSIYGNLSEPASNGQKSDNDNKDVPKTEKELAAFLTEKFPKHSLAVFEDGPVRLSGKDGKLILLWEHAPDDKNKPKVQQWYKDRCDGRLPKNWGIQPLIPAARQDAVKIGDLKDSTSTAALAVKDTSTKKVGVVEPSMVLDDSSKKDIKSFAVKIFGNNSDTSKKDITLSSESQTKSLAVQLDDTRFSEPMGHVARYHMSVEQPNAMALWSGDFMYRAMNAEKLVTILREENSKLLEAATKPAATPVVAKKTGTDDEDFI